MQAVTDTLAAIWAAAQASPLLILAAVVGGAWFALRRRGR
jgi:hypothetical protein